MLDSSASELLGGLREPIFRGRDTRIVTSASQSSDSTRAREWRELEIELLGADAPSAQRDLASPVASLGGAFTLS